VTKLKLLILVLATGLLAIQLRHPIHGSLFNRPVEALPSAEKAPEPEKPAPQPLVSQALVNYEGLLTRTGESLDGQGVLVETLDAKQIIASHNIDHTFNPASVTKIATSLAALVKFGPNYHLKTTLYADGDVDRSARTINGNLVLDTDGDPMFFVNNAQELAQNLVRAGINKVSGDLVIKGPFSINRNSSPQASADKMMAAFRGAGVKFGGNLRFADGRGGQTELVAYECGTPLIQILLYQNAHSDNPIAERIGDSIGGPQGLQQFLIKSVGVKPEDVYISRTSGLDYNRISPRAMILILRRLMDLLDAQQLKPEDLLPVAGVDDGTLRTRFKGDEWHGAVIGKTGSLPGTDGGVSTLAGIAYSQKYGPILYAIFNSGGNVPQYRRWQDDLLEGIIAECGGPAIGARQQNGLNEEIRTEPSIHIIPPSQPQDSATTSQ